MSVIMQQYTVPASNTVACFQIPPGYFYATMYNLGAQSIYLSTSAVNATPTSGLVLHTVPTTFQGSMTSKGALVFATTGNSTAASFNLMMITDQ